MGLASKHSIHHAGSTLERRAVAVAESLASLVTPIGVTAVPDGPIGFRIANQSGLADEWIVTDAESDPQLSSGTFVMPDSVIAKLELLDRKGARFDRLYVAHELPTGSLKADVVAVSVDELPKLVPSGSAHAKVDRTLRIVTRLARLTVGGVMAPVALAGIAPAALAVGALALDPALIGVITASGTAQPGELAVWFLIEAWR